MIRPVSAISLAHADTDDARQALRAAGAGRDGQSDLGQAETRALGADADVAGERQLQPAAEGVALDRGDGRHGQIGQALEGGFLACEVRATGDARHDPRSPLRPNPPRTRDRRCR